MANREELAIIRGARSGNVEAQLALGKRYLFGSTGLPRSLPTALHWLDRAARQGCTASCELIGSHIPLDLARDHGAQMSSWYERAYDAGNVRAGLVWAQLSLDYIAGAPGSKLLQALQDAARAGFAEAAVLLARSTGSGATGSAAAGPGLAAIGSERARHIPERRSATPATGQAAQAAPWLRRAADNGLAEAQFALIEQHWQAGAWHDYLACALPLARCLIGENRGQQGRRLAPGEVTLLSRTARLLADPVHAPLSVDQAELQAFWELAAAEHDPHAQLSVGLWYARMQVDGVRTTVGSGAANFKKAVRWLLLAGEQGLASAWYALSRIYLKPEFSQRNVAAAQRYLERAAEMGYQVAQLECGNNAWRARRENESNDVRAVFWLQQAAIQGNAEASAALHKIAPRPQDALHTDTGALLAQAAERQVHPLLLARLELASLFGLTRAETLLMDVAQADRGHCLVIDIRASYGRSKRRLVMVETQDERLALNRIVPLFAALDAGPSGPEGNYRQRLYRLRTLLGAAAVDDGAAAVAGAVADAVADAVPGAVPGAVTGADADATPPQPPKSAYGMAA